MRDNYGPGTKRPIIGVSLSGAYGSWKHDYSGLRPMSGWRAEQVEREIRQAQERRKGA